MKLRLFITAMMLGLTLPAAADFKTIAEAYEVALSEIRLPQSESGTIAFRPCAGCDFQTRRIDGSTRWLINGEAVSLDRFRATVRRVADRKTEAVTILHHLERNRVTEVSVYL